MGDMFTSVGTNNSLDEIDALRKRIADLEAALRSIVAAPSPRGDTEAYRQHQTVRVSEMMRDIAQRALL